VDLASISIAIVVNKHIMRRHFGLRVIGVIADLFGLFYIWRLKIARDVIGVEK